MLRIAAFGIPLALVLGVALYAMFHEPMPNAGTMRLLFVDRQLAFERRNEELLRAAAEGRPYDTGPDNRIGYRFVRRVADPPGFEYITHIEGVGTGAFGTGIAYLEKPPKKLYPSIEAMTDDAKAVEGFVGYGAIRPPWYFFLREAD